MTFSNYSLTKKGTPMAVNRKRSTLMKMQEVMALAAKELGISTLTVRRMIQQGKLPAPAIQANLKSRWWRREDIQAWLEGRLAA
jgi:excisionase family DNA binding protein